MPFSPQYEQQANHSLCVRLTHSRWGRFVADERSAPLKHTGADMIHLSPEGFTERRLTFPWSRRRVPLAYWCSSPPIQAQGLLQTPRLRTKHLSLARESDLRCNQSRSRGERLRGRCDQSTQGALSGRLGKSRFTCLFVYPDPCWRFNVLRSRNLLQEDNGVRAVAGRDGWIRAWVSQSWEGQRCRREPKLSGDNRTHSGFATRRSRHYTTAWMRNMLCREDIVHKFRPENVVGIEMLKLQLKNLKNT